MAGKHTAVAAALTLRAASMTQVEGSEDSLRSRLEQLHWTPRQSALGKCPLAFPFPTQEAGAQGDEDKKGWTDRKTPCHEPYLI